MENCVFYESCGRGTTRIMNSRLSRVYSAIGEATRSSRLGHMWCSGAIAQERQYLGTRNYGSLDNVSRSRSFNL